MTISLYISFIFTLPNIVKCVHTNQFTSLRKKMSHTMVKSVSRFAMDISKQFANYQFQINIYLDLKLCLYLNNDVLQTIVA